MAAAAFLSLSLPDEDTVEHTLSLGRVAVPSDFASLFLDTFLTYGRVYILLKVDFDHVAILRMDEAPGQGGDDDFAVTRVVANGRKFPIERAYDTGDLMEEGDVALVAMALFGERIQRGVLRGAQGEFANLIAERCPE
jgi:hypothetical protein